VALAHRREGNGWRWVLSPGHFDVGARNSHGTRFARNRGRIHSFPPGPVAALETPGAPPRYAYPVNRARTGHASRLAAGKQALSHAHAGRDPSALEPAEAAALSAALAEIPSAAWVIWADGRVALANGRGRSEIVRDAEVFPSRLRASLAGRDDTIRVTRILAPRAPLHYLAVQRRGSTDPAQRLAAAAARWDITPGQSRVLALLALGQTNKTIADALECAESTVEVHVTALLARSGCENRCELVSRFWSEPMG